MSEYAFESASPLHTHRYLWPGIERIIAENLSADGRVFDLGCGNGAFLKRLRSIDCQSLGVDPSESGVAMARRNDPDLQADVGSCYDPLSQQYGQFPVVVSLEVVEHIYSPREYAKCVFDLVEPGGIAVISTPFHGYWKNLLIAATGASDSHFTALWDHGHIKFWSPATLTRLCKEAGFASVEYQFAGRFYPFSKSMIAVARRPAVEVIERDQETNRSIQRRSAAA